jgi:hypothetical protein
MEASDGDEGQVQVVEFEGAKDTQGALVFVARILRLDTAEDGHYRFRAFLSTFFGLMISRCIDSRTVFDPTMLTLVDCIRMRRELINHGQGYINFILRNLHESMAFSLNQTGRTILHGCSSSSGIHELFTAWRTISF